MFSIETCGYFFVSAGLMIIGYNYSKLGKKNRSAFNNVIWGWIMALVGAFLLMVYLIIVDSGGYEYTKLQLAGLTVLFLILTICSVVSGRWGQIVKRKAIAENILPHVVITIIVVAADVGSVIYIIGDNFASNAQVFFGETIAEIDEQATTESQIKVSVPYFETSQSVEVTVRIDGMTSNPQPFYVIVP